MDSFESLEVWKRSQSLCVQLYRRFRDCKDWGFKDQITRSALSIPSNIAEGYERSSRKEYVQFLRIAKGSCGELRSQLLIGKVAGLMESAVADEMIQEAREIGRMLGAMVVKLARAA